MSLSMLIKQILRIELDIILEEHNFINLIEVPRMELGMNFGILTNQLDIIIDHI
jgi:hypothetical protein